MQQAHRLLPAIHKKIKTLRKVQETIDMLGEIEVECDDIVMDYHYNLKIEKEYFRLQHEFYKILEQLEEAGCLLKDLDLGLVDFVHQHEGQDVFLCWKEGEKTSNSGMTWKKGMKSANRLCMRKDWNNNGQS